MQNVFLKLKTAVKPKKKYSKKNETQFDRPSTHVAPHLLSGMNMTKTRVIFKHCDVPHYLPFKFVESESWIIFQFRLTGSCCLKDPDLIYCKRSLT